MSFLLWTLRDSSFVYFKIDFRDRGEKRERKKNTRTQICCSIYLCICWLFLVCVLTGNQIHNLSINLGI